MDLWAACREEAQPGPLGGELLRVVESQESIATNALVDDLAEQAQLEALLEAAKPPLPPETRGLHYLLATPFRYPPLRHGSRFGARHEPGIFYGAKALHTALAETAYYRLRFWEAMAEAPPAGKLVTEHTVFAARYRVGRGLRLQDPPFDRYRGRIADPASYVETQPLGRALRAAGIEAFEYPSARDRRGGINVALFSPRALVGRRPRRQQRWLCETRAERISFLSATGESQVFPREDLLVGGALPRPAA